MKRRAGISRICFCAAMLLVLAPAAGCGGDGGNEKDGEEDGNGADVPDAADATDTIDVAGDDAPDIPPDDGDRPGDGCPLSQLERTLVAEIVNETWMLACQVADHAVNENEYGFPIALVASNEQSLRTFVGPSSYCTGPASVPPDCSPVDLHSGDETSRCEQFTCEEADLLVISHYYTVAPHTEPGDRHSLGYGSEWPEGDVLFDPNPLIAWRHDERTEGVRTVTAAVDMHPVFTPPSGGPVDLLYRGEIALEASGGAEQSLVLDLELPHVPGTGPALEVHFERTGGGDPEGAVTLDGEKLAELWTDGMNIQWLGECR